MVISIVALVWVSDWPNNQTASAFRIAPMAPYLVLVTILNGRVHRNTKLGLYNKVSLESSDPKSIPNPAAYSMLPSGNSHSIVKPIQIAVTQSHVADTYTASGRSDYPTTRSRGSVNSLDFGMV